MKNIKRLFITFFALCSMFIPLHASYAIISPTGPPEIGEPNNIDAQAYQVSLNKSYRTLLTHQSDIDIYKFTSASFSQSLNLKFDGDYELFDVDVYYYDATGTRKTVLHINSTDSIPTLTTGSSFTTLPNVQYYLCITAANPVFGDFYYRFSVDEVDSYENNDTTLTAVQILPDIIYSSYIRNQSDVDYYKIIAPRTARMFVQVKAQLKTSQLNVTIYDKTNQIVATGNQNYLLGTEVPFTSTSGNSYYVCISDTSNNNLLSMNPYQIETITNSSFASQYLYDANNRLLSINVSHGLLSYKTIFTYDNNGNLTKRTSSWL